MMKHLLSVAAIVVVASAFADQPLVVGSKAPAINVAKWVKGSPVKLGGGNVNVVEFWATWCGPCKVSIPHLTEMAHKYKGRVTFTGVSVWETRGEQPFTGVPEKVAKFVKDMGPKMDYVVAMDGADRKMATTWMEAAHQDGIPTAFVVDGTGTLVWIGHPMDNLDGVLDKVLAGKWDLKAEAKRSAEAAAAREDLQKAAALFEKAQASGDPKQMLVAVDEAIAKYPRTESELGVAKFNLMLAAGKVDEAHQYATTRLYDLFKDEGEKLNELAWGMVEKPAPGVKFDVAVKLAERANEVSGGKNPMILDTLALAYFRRGDKVKAISIEETAVSLAKKSAGFDATTLKEIEGRLAEFKGSK